MIDTDKYEGHTPAPWMMGEYKGRPSIHAGDETFVRSIARGLNPSQTADHALLLDAPLLLEEVKRLHVEVRALRKAQGYDMKFPVEVLAIDELMSENRQLRRKNRQLRAMLKTSNTVDGDD